MAMWSFLIDLALGLVNEASSSLSGVEVRRRLAGLLE